MSADHTSSTNISPSRSRSEFRAASGQRTFLPALAIFAAAFVIRALFFTVQVAHHPAPWTHAAPFAQAEMGHIATNLYEGRGFSSPFSNGATATAWICPLIPFLWACVMSLLHGANGYTARALVYLDAAASALSVVFYWLIARHAGQKIAGFSRYTPLVVAALFCLWPESLLGVSNLWYYNWQELGTALLVLLAMQWLDRPCVKTVIPLALAAGCVGLINVTPVPIFAVALVLPLMSTSHSRGAILRAAAFGASVALIVVLPWMIRNDIALGAVVPLRSNAGVELLEGNNPDGSVRQTARSLHPALVPEEFQRYQQLGEAAYSRKALHKALAYIRTHPLATLRRTAERAYVLWFSDTFDQWSWDGSRWWQNGIRAQYRAIAVSLSAWGTVILMVWAFLSKRFAALPYRALFLSVLFILPFPYYFTIAGDEFGQLLRSWLLLLSVLAFHSAFRRRAQ